MAGFTANGEVLQSVSVDKEIGGASYATGQVSVTGTATALVAVRGSRRALLIVQHGTTAVYIGGPGVATSTGVLLVGSEGSSMSVPTTGAVYGIVASGTQVVSYMEVYD
jgi:hypothetical protein